MSKQYRVHEVDFETKRTKVTRFDTLEEAHAWIDTKYPFKRKSVLIENPDGSVWSACSCELIRTSWEFTPKHRSTIYYVTTENNVGVNPNIGFGIYDNCFIDLDVARKAAIERSRRHNQDCAITQDRKTVLEIVAYLPKESKPEPEKVFYVGYSPWKTEKIHWIFEVPTLKEARAICMDRKMTHTHFYIGTDKKMILEVFPPIRCCRDD